jgi:hypothetical protein
VAVVVETVAVEIPAHQVALVVVLRVIHPKWQAQLVYTLGLLISVPLDKVMMVAVV